jgi:2-polyprenyl-3-methyl-5-hydroxy-6-metoxy-1,4-benzoquinol methylase
MKCKHVQIFPVPTPYEDKKFYDEDRQAKNTNYQGSISKLKHKTNEDVLRRADLVKSITPKKGSILEIGSGYGFFLEEMQKQGYKIIGIEISKERRKYSKKITRVKVLNINLNKKIPDIDKFDTVVLFQVFEHIVDPISFLKNIKKLLKPGGKVIIEVPNFNDFQLKLNKSYLEWYWQRAHIHYFSAEILSQILSRARFIKIKVFGTQRYSIENMFSWKLTNKPQLNDPTYSLSKEYEWIENHYKIYLEKNLKCDTLMVVGTSSNKKKSRYS